MLFLYAKKEERMNGTKVGTRNENLKTQMDESLFDFIEFASRHVRRKDGR